MPRPVHFDIAASDPAAAMAFYGAAFGWSFTPFDDGDYWLITTGAPERPGIDGGLIRRTGPRPSVSDPVSGAVLFLEVGDLCQTRDAALQAGGELVRDKTAVAGVGWSARLRDPDNNQIALFQNDPEAA